LTTPKSIVFEIADGLTIDFNSVNQGTYAALNGIKLTAIGEGFVQGEIDINPSLKNPNGYLHGGVSATLADTLAIFGCVYLYRVTTVSTINFNVSFLRPVQTGRITAKGRILSKGRNVSMWRVEVFDDSSHPVAEATVTVAIAMETKPGFPEPPETVRELGAALKGSVP
jgi:1,4-dihydroxy-2-naphthoyl-CoA hydrolase